ncbi:MAG TPA: hypothetical protein VFY29_01025 [Terriglobia bacterium]|nr:hypothetical protein [Terriglobia bacterium]
MSPTVSTFLLEAVNFLILAAALSWVLFKPVRRALEDRRAAENRRRAEAEARLQEAESARDAALEERRHLRSELDGMRSEALAASQKEAADIRAAAVAAATREEENARRRVARLDQSELEQTAEAAAAAARELVRKLLTDIDGPDLEAALVRAACRELERLGGSGLLPVAVESAVPLPSDARAAIGKAAGAGEAVTFVVRPDLGAGLRIRTARGEIDASATGFSIYTQRELERHLATARGDAG